MNEAGPSWALPRGLYWPSRSAVRAAGISAESAGWEFTPFARAQEAGRTRVALGDAAFTAAWDAGRAWTREHTIAAALRVADALVERCGCSPSVEPRG
jgi:hypothetical protein